MPNYLFNQHRLYHNTLVSEFFWQLENVMDVLRGRAQHQQRFKEATLSTTLSLLQSAGTVGSVVASAGNVVLMFLGQLQENKKVQTLTPEHLSGQWEVLKQMVNTTAEMAVERYRYFLEKCTEVDAVELGRVSAQRLWEYVSSEKLSLTVDAMLMGILKGKSGFLEDDWRNTGLTSTTTSNKRQTAEGALERAGIAYCDIQQQWCYALHARDKGADFPKYGFMLLPEALAKARITEKQYIPFTPSTVQAQSLENMWSTPLTHTQVVDSSLTTLFSSLTDQECSRLQQLEIDWLSFGEWRSTVESRLKQLQMQTAANQAASIEVKERIITLENDTANTQTNLVFVKQTVAIQGEQQEEHHEKLNKLAKNVTDLSEQRRFTYIPKPYFQPRESLWKILEQRFSEKDAVSPIAIIGSGGMGKTSLINQWVEKQKFSGKYHTTRRMVMDDISIEGSLVDLARDLYVTVEKRKQEIWLPEVAQRLKTQSWLMVWDNVENYAAIKNYLPYFIHEDKQEAIQHLVVTSRDTTCWTDPIFVDTFSPEESITYIEHQMKAAASPHYNKQQAQALAEYFADHPLALELAMGAVCLYQRPLDKYFEELKAAGTTTLQATKQRLDSHERINFHALATLWKMGLAKLTNDATSLLRLMSFVSAKGVSREFLMHFLDKNNNRYQDALLTLRQYAFVQSTNNPTREKWKMHRLLQDVVREEALQAWKSDEHLLQNFMKTGLDTYKFTFFRDEEGKCKAPNGLVLVQFLPHEVRIEGMREGIDHGTHWLGHITLFSCYQNNTLPILWQMSLLGLIGRGEHAVALFESARKHYMQALSLAYKTYGENTDHAEIAAAQSNLGQLYVEEGNYVEAERYYNKALNMQKSLHSEDINHPEIAGILNGLGTLYCAKNDLESARISFTSALKMQRAFYGEYFNCLEIAATLNNLGLVDYADIKADDALTHFKNALEMLKNTLYGTINHPGIASILNSIGLVYGAAKRDYPTSRDYHQHAFDMSKALYGENANHPIMATTLHNIAFMYYMENNMQDSEKYYVQTLKMQRIIYPNNRHLCIAETLNNLGLVYIEVCAYDKAQECYDEALSIQYIIFGRYANHIDIAGTLSNIGNLHEANEKYNQAQKYFKHVLDMQLLIYGENANHANIIKTFRRLGLMCAVEGMNGGTKEMLDDALKYYLKALTMQHHLYSEDINRFDIVETLVDLATLYKIKEDATNACVYYSQILTMQKTLYGKGVNHPDIVKTLNDFGLMCQKALLFSQAKMCFKQSLAMSKALGFSDDNKLIIEASEALIENNSDSCVMGCVQLCCCPCKTARKALECCGFFKTSTEILHAKHSIESSSLERDSIGLTYFSESSNKSNKHREETRNPLTAPLIMER